MTRVDHLLISVRSLDPAMQRWADAGLPAVAGGSHPGGTFNALVRGPRRAYVELISAQKDATSEAALRVLSCAGPLSWALGVDDLDPVRRALEGHRQTAGPIEDGSRTTPDGQRLSWRLCDVGLHALHEFQPFLIEWETDMEPGPQTGPTLTSLTLEVPDPLGLGGLLQVCGLVMRSQNPTSVVMTDGEVEVLLRRGSGRITQASFELAGGPGGELDLDGLVIRRDVRGLTDQPDR